MSWVSRTLKEQPGKFFFISTKDRSGTWQDHPFKRSQLGDMDAFVEQNQDKDVYFCVHAFAKPRRLKRYAEPPKLLWADLDEVDPRGLGNLMPTIAWESSPGRFAGLWRIDTFATEELNRRLTYHLGADLGGWDFSQVLRYPGTTNYKYDSAPKVKTLWTDGPEYTSKDIFRRLPREKSAVMSDRDAVRGIYRKYEGKMPGWLRRTIYNRQAVKPGKRSDILWKMNCTLQEIGATADEIFELLRVSPWNKFVKRRDGDEQLRREIDKGLTQHMEVVDDEGKRDELERDDGDDDDDDKPYQFLKTPMSEVVEENLDWIWYPYLARGELTILEGDPGLGKSYLAQVVSAAICDGSKLPSPDPRRRTPVQGKVAYFDMENAAGSVTKKRLVANGCEHLENFFQEMEPFSVDDDDAIETVYDAIDKLRPTLVVFDTVNTYMGGADIHNSAETQQVFKKFVDIARRYKCAVMVLRHLTKTSKGVQALYRGQGSIAFAGVARVVLTIGTDPDDDSRRVMAVTKLNVAKRPQAITFGIESLPDTLRESDRSKFLWGEFVDLTSEQIVAHREREVDTELEETVDWLREVLSDGPVEFERVMRMGEPRGVSDVTVRRAAGQLKIDKTKTRDGVMWSLPIGGAEAASDGGE